MNRKIIRFINWKPLASGGWVLLLSLLSEVNGQTPEPPPTSGNTVTIILGLTASSLVVIIVGVWVARGIRKLWLKPAEGIHDEPGNNGSSSIYCTQCGEPLAPGDRFCHICGATVKELT